MCGVFGAVSMNGNALSVPLLRRMALDAQSRGRHAHGLAWVTTGGALRPDKAPGAFGDKLDLVDVAARSQAVIGHCRFTTMGDPKVNRNNHPHYVEDGLFVHNGKVENYGHLVSSRGLEPETGCDSEVIGLMVEQYRGGLLQRIERSVNAVDGSMALLGLWSRPFRMAVVRRGRPLYGCAWDGVWYFCSLPWALPQRGGRDADDQGADAGAERGSGPAPPRRLP